MGRKSEGWLEQGVDERGGRSPAEDDQEPEEQHEDAGRAWRCRRSARGPNSPRG